MAAIKKYNGSTFVDAAIRKYSTASEIIVPPTTIYCDGSNITTYTIKGNTVQNGTPTPSAPIAVQGVGELETTGEHSGEYKIPILTAQGSAVNYLGSVQSTRQIKKLVFDGTENWTLSDKHFNLSLTDRGSSDGYAIISTHFQVLSQSPNLGIVMVSNGVEMRVYDIAQQWTTVTDFTTFLQQQYANGTPVTVWYVLQTATTGIVNEPLMKIGTYYDSISNATPIPTSDGANSITVDTTVQPSEFTATWTGWHNAYVKEKSENLFNATVESGAISSGAGTDLDNNERLRSSYLDLAAGTYTLGASGSAVNVFLYLYNTDGSYVGTYSDSWSLYPFTFTLNTAMKCRFVWKKSAGGVISVSDISQIMLNTGGTLLPYAPYWK